MTIADARLHEIEALVGTEVGVSHWVTLTQDAFDTFADVTGDKDWLHNDPERCARESPFGGKTIAQGHLLLAHLSQFAESLMPATTPDIVYALNYGYDRVRIIQPVTVGSRIRGRLTLKAIRAKGENRYVFHNDVAVEVDGSDTPHLAAEWLFMIQLAHAD